MKTPRQETPDPRPRKKRREEREAESDENAVDGAGATPVNPFDGLANEVVLRVLEYVDPHERLNELPKVCRRFRDLAWDEAECRRIYKRRFSERETPGRTYLSRLGRSVRAYREDERARASLSENHGDAFVRERASMRTALMAASRGHEILLRDALSEVVASGAAVPRHTSTVLSGFALKNDDTRCFEILLDIGLAKDSSWWPSGMAEAAREEKTLLLAYQAAAFDAVKCLGVLEQRGLDLCALNRTSMFHPLLGAVRESRTACAEFLLDRGVPLPMRESQTDGPLRLVNLFALAARSRSTRAVETIEFLRRNPPHGPWGEGQFDPTERRLRRARNAALGSGTARAFRHLLELVGFADFHGDACKEHLVMAHARTLAPFEGVEKLRAMVDHGASLDATYPPAPPAGAGPEPTTALQFCIARTRFVGALEFLQAGADPNARAHGLPPPLHMFVLCVEGDDKPTAVYDKHTAVYLLRALLHFGADPGTRSFHSGLGVLNVLELAECTGKTFLVEVLRQHAATQIDASFRVDDKQRT